MYDLSILIPTMPYRKQKFDRLMDNLNTQKRPNVDINVLSTDNSLDIATKRNLMLSNSKGRYTAFIDDDDVVKGNYIDSILAALESEPDCVGFKLAYIRDGIHSATIDQSMKFKTHDKKVYRKNDGSAFNYVSKPINHINAIKSDLFRKIGFPSGVKYGEDRLFSLMLQRFLTSEEYIDDHLYYYLFDSNDNSLKNMQSGF